MHKLTIGCFVAALILTTTLAAQTPPTTTQPKQPAPVITVVSKAKVDVAQTDFDFGFIPSDAYVSHAFWLRSTGLDSLRILSVKPG